MRATRDGRHCGGAERLVTESDWPDALQKVSDRARSYGGDTEIFITSELIPADTIQRRHPLPVRTMPAKTTAEARSSAARLLSRCGVSEAAITTALDLLDRGPGPNNSVMRGGVVMDAATGERLEPDRERGVRATRVDFTAQCRSKTAAALAAEGLTNLRVIEALAIATKSCWSGSCAEICWSDDPDYVAGYVAGSSIGYCRFRQIKEPGVAVGGRVFFLASASGAPEFIARLERAPLLIDLAPVVSG